MISLYMKKRTSEVRNTLPDLSSHERHRIPAKNPSVSMIALNTNLLRKEMVCFMNRNRGGNPNNLHKRLEGNEHMI